MSKQPIKQKLAKLSKKVKLNRSDKALMQEVMVAAASGNLPSIFKDSEKRVEAFELSNKIYAKLHENKWRHHMVFARKENPKNYCGTCVRRVVTGLAHFYVLSGMMDKDGVVELQRNRSTGEVISPDTQLRDMERLQMAQEKKDTTTTTKQPNEDSNGETEEGGAS